MNITRYKTPVAWLIFCTLVLSTGCKKLLDRKPLDSLTRSEFFQTESDANAAIIGVYDALQECVGQFLLWGEARADLVSATTNNDQTYPYFQLFTDARDISNWSKVYTMIGRANIILESVPGITSTDRFFTAEKRDAILAEARFMRALGYFYLVRIFKEVPLVLDAPSSDDVVYRIPKSSADVVLDKIEEDLNFAEQHIKVTYSREIENRGRATLGAVNALQTDVFLWRAKYQDAANAAKKVMDNTALYKLLPAEDWFTLFSQKNTTESVFELQFDYNRNETNELKATSTLFNASTVLLDYYTGDQDMIRGLNSTYRSSGGAQFWKYIGLNRENVERPTKDPNFIVYRLADVILMRAEALAHLSFEDKAEAIRLVDLIRTRALIATYSGGEGVNGGLTTDQIVDFILKERAMELAMEGKRWFDLLRIATNDKREDLLVSNILLSRSVGDRTVIRARIIDPKSWYLPILRTELDNNPMLVQNPYYKQ